MRLQLGNFISLISANSMVSGSVKKAKADISIDFSALANY